MVIQGVSWVMTITVGDDFLGLCNKKFSTNMGPVLNDYGTVGVL
jgi:hypothetical protein